MRNAILGGVFAALATTAFAADVTIETAAGPATLETSPSPLAVLDVAAIDTLTTLGVEVDGIPNKLYVPYLADLAEKATAVGTLFEPDFEALAVLAPEVIIAGGRSAAQVEPLGKVATTIDMTITGTSMVNEGKARIASYGELFEKTAEAEALNAKIDAKLAEAKEAVSGKGNALIVLTNGAKISAYGPGSRFGWIHDDIGLPVAYEGLAAETHGYAISFEFIAETNPDWILVVDRGAAIGQDGQSAQATLDNPLVAKTTAAQNNQIVYLSSAPLYIAGGGATSIQVTLDEIIDAFSKSGS